MNCPFFSTGTEGSPTRSTFCGMRHGWPDWKTNIGATDHPFARTATMPVLSCANGNSQTPDAVRRCFRCVQYGLSFNSRVVGSMNAFSAPSSGADCVQPDDAPICVKRGTHV